MATYVVLGDFTEQGIKNVMKTAIRAEDFRQMAIKRGAVLKEHSGLSARMISSKSSRRPTKWR